jgi:gliding motility-associated-like protein
MLFIVAAKLQAQLCTGSLGDPLVNFTFGAGANPGAALSAATTAYQYVTNDCPADGFYTVRSNTSNCFNNTWYNLNADHTGDAGGYFMLINASIQPSAFYVDTVRGLCGNSTYEFAAWMANVLRNTSCGANGIQPNISFSIEKLDGTVIGNFNTGNIAAGSNAIEWKQYGFFFITPIGITDVVLRMTNNATGGCGNDIALDDITFRPCGPKLTPSIIGLPSASSALCEGAAQTFNFACLVSAGFNTPTYQWQQSFNGGGYNDIALQNSNTLQVNFIATSAIGTYKYRLSVAELGNLNSQQCRISSEPITIIINQNPTTTCTNNGPICAGNAITLTATGGIIYQWTGPNGFMQTGNPISINNITANNAGSYSVLVKDINGCENIDLTNVAVLAKPVVATSFIDTSICVGKSVQLLATAVGNVEWTPATKLTNTNIFDPIAIPIVDTKYTVIITNSQGCKDSAYSNINVIQKPIVNAGADKIIVANKTVFLDGNITGNIDNFEWSPADFINNINTLTPIVNPPVDKEYTLTANANRGCGVVSDKVFVKIYQGIFIPNSFTPNADTKNDTWNIPALEAYPLHELVVYNRYGQIVFERKQSFNGWDGKYKDQPLPNGAYAYVIDLKNGTALLKGTVLIIR